MPPRKVITALLALPLLWVASLAYAQWIEPTGAPPSSPIPGLVWLFPPGATERNQGSIRLGSPGTISTSGQVTASTGEFSGFGSAVLSTAALTPGASALIAQQASGSFAGNFYGTIRIDNDSTTGLPAGCIRYSGTALQFSNTCTEPYTDFGGAGGVGGAALWSLEGTGPNIFKTTAAGVVGIGTLAPTAVFPAGTKLGLVGDAGTGARLYLSNATGNAEIDWRLSASANDHIGLYADTAARQLRLWAKQGAGDAAGDNRFAFTSDGVMVFYGWWPPAFDFTVGAVPSSGTVTAGQATAPSTVTVTRTAGNAASVAFSTTGLPAGATANFTPAACTPSASSPFTCTASLAITTGASTPAGTFAVSVRGTSGSTVRATTYTLTVNAAAGNPRLTVVIVGDGQVTDDKGNIACDGRSTPCSTTAYAKDESVTLRATETAGRFLGWSNATLCRRPTDPVCTFTMPSVNTSLTATFEGASGGPTVDSIEPASAGAGEELEAVVFGSGLLNAEQVTFTSPDKGSIDVAIVDNRDDTKLTVTLRVSNDATPGEWSFTVAGPGGTSSPFPFEVR